MRLVNSGKTLIGGGKKREGYPGKVLFGLFFFENSESVVVGELSQLILSPRVGTGTDTSIK